MNTLKNGVGLMAGLALFLGSCTISDKNNEPTEPGSAKLKTISLYGTVMTSYSYDSNGRLTNIGDLMTGSRIKISYSPFTMVYEGYHDEYFDTATPTEKITWSNIQTNSDGYMISANLRSEEYNYDSWGNTEYIDEGVSTYTYDSEGHLLSIQNNFTDGDVEVSSFTWENGLLTRMILDEDDFQIFTYENALPNVNYQWIPYWGDLVYFCSGLMGKAPSKYISTIEDYYGNQLENYVDYHYSLNEGGYVSQLQTLVDTDGTEYIKFSFNYESTRAFEDNFKMENVGKKLSTFNNIPFKRHSR